jgi:FtsH-binding integral membrane protein
MSSIASVYAHLAGATALTAVFAEIPVIPQTVVGVVLEVIVLLGLTFVLIGMSPGPLKYVAFGVLVFVAGNLLSTLTQRLQGKGVLLKVLAMVAGVFLGMTALALALPGRFLGFGPFLFAGLLGLILARVGIWIAGLAEAPQEDLKQGSTALTYIGVVLFALYVAFDTQVLRTRMGARLAKKDPIGATLSFYLDILNLYSHIGELMDQ